MHLFLTINIYTLLLVVSLEDALLLTTGKDRIDKLEAEEEANVS
jgi:hypothetical protein